MHAFTSTLPNSMAPILAQQLVSSRPLPFHKSRSSGIPQDLWDEPTATLLQAEAWHKALATYTKQEWVAALVRGMQYGFRTGLQESLQCRASTSTTPSSKEYAGVVDQYTRDKSARGTYMASLFPSLECSNVCVYVRHSFTLR